MNFLFASMLLASSLSMARHAGEPVPEGRWLTTKKDTVVRIERCGGSLCGYIDWVHPDEEQVTPGGESLCEQKVLWGFEQSESDSRLWRGGRIYRADDDKEYSGRIRLLDHDELRVRGYIGVPFLGKSYTLTRVQEPVYPSCGTTMRD